MAAIRDAAWRLFSDRGYARTTIAAIAAEAGVAVPTAYFCFGSKAAIASGLSEVVERQAGIIPLHQEALAEPDPHRRLELIVAIARRTGEVTARFLDIVRASREPALLDAWDRIDRNGRSGIGEVVDKIARSDSMRVGLTPARAADMVWAMTSPEVYVRLTKGAEWSGKEYEANLVAALAAFILA